MEPIKPLRKVDETDYIEDQTVTIGAGGGSDDVTDVPKTPDIALEFEWEGRRYVLLAYETKS